MDYVYVKPPRDTHILLRCVGFPFDTHPNIWMRQFERTLSLFGAGTDVWPAFFGGNSLTGIGNITDGHSVEYRGGRSICLEDEYDGSYPLSNMYDFMRLGVTDQIVDIKYGWFV